MTHRALVVEKTEEDFRVGVEQLEDRAAGGRGDGGGGVVGFELQGRVGVHSERAGGDELSDGAGIDFAGTVVESSSPDFRRGMRWWRRGTSWGRGTRGGTRSGRGCRRPGWQRLPEGLTAEEAMVLGTAG